MACYKQNLSSTNFGRFQKLKHPLEFPLQHVFAGYLYHMKNENENKIKFCWAFTLENTLGPGCS
jgi:hypothetical protein